MAEKLIQSMQDFEAYFPPGSVIYESNNEWGSPCPVCTENSPHQEKYEFNGHTFYGHDRFSWIFEQNAFFCRVCREAGRGNNGWFTIEKLADIFEAYVDIDESIEPRTRELKPITTWQRRQVINAYTQVRRDFWYKFGWTDEVIDRFRLGYGRLFDTHDAGHLIPMQVQKPHEDKNPNAWYVAARLEDGRKDHLSGSIKPYLWLIDDNKDSELIVVAEGEKDAITAWLLGFKNIACMFGTTHLTKAKIKFLFDIGYRQVYAFGDSDSAGEAFNRNVFSWAEESGMDSHVLSWEEETPNGYDISDLLQQYGILGAFEYIQTHLVKLEKSTVSDVIRPTFIDDFKTIDMTYEPEKVDIVPLSEIRGSGILSINYQLRHFLDNYSTLKKRGRGVVKLLRAGPGSGKTYELVRVAERVAMLSQREKFKERWELLQQIRNIEEQLQASQDIDERETLNYMLRTLRRRLDNFTFESVVVAMPFKDSWNDLQAAGANTNLWFNFSARDTSNCQNFEFAKELGRNRHDIGTYCKLGCPFRQACEESGYLSQEKLKKQKPITVYRHQHLSNIRAKDLLIVDESPFHVMEEPLVFESSQVYPHQDTWDLDVDDSEMVVLINIFTDAIRQAMNQNVGQPPQLYGVSPNENYMISGAAFLRLVDRNIKAISENKYDLQKTIEEIDLNILQETYQPTHKVEDQDGVRVRCVPFLYQAIDRELEDYVENPDNNFPSCIHLVAGKLEIYLMKKVKVSSNIPIIEADATAMLPELYAAMFNRELDIYSPTIYNANAEVTVIRGTDWTLKQLESNLGRELKDRNKRTAKVQDMLGDDFLLDEIPMNPELYKNKLMIDYRDMVLTFAERHRSLLVVTHKKIRGALEDLITHSYPKLAERIAWGHYGALRGTNAFRDYEAVVLIGVSRIPYDIMWRRIQAWARLAGIKENIPFEMGYHPAPYHTQTVGHTYFTFNHPFARKYADMVEMGEMIQCLERIRPHATEERKFVYVCASRPVAPFVKKIVTKSEVLNYHRSDSKINRIKKEMLDVKKRDGKFPTKIETMEKYKCGYNTYRKAKDLAEKEIANAKTSISEGNGSKSSDSS